MKSVRGTVKHFYEDQDGVSPYAEPCWIDFEADYLIEPGEPRDYARGDPGCSPTVEIVCYRPLSITTESYERVLTKEEGLYADLAAWLPSMVDDVVAELALEQEDHLGEGE